MYSYMIYNYNILSNVVCKPGLNRRTAEKISVNRVKFGQINKNIFSYNMLIYTGEILLFKTIFGQSGRIEVNGKFDEKMYV